MDWVSFSSFVDWVSFSSFVDFGSSIYCEKQSGLITVNHGYNECLELLHGQITVVCVSVVFSMKNNNSRKNSLEI